MEKKNVIPEITPDGEVYVLRKWKREIKPDDIEKGDYARQNGKENQVCRSDR